MTLTLLPLNLLETFTIVLHCFYSLGFLIWQLYEAFKKYYSYPTDTEITTGSKTRMEFPSLSICNLNPMRKSALLEAGEEFNSQFGGSVRFTFFFGGGGGVGRGLWALNLYPEYEYL